MRKKILLPPLILAGLIAGYLLLGSESQDIPQENLLEIESTLAAPTEFTLETLGLGEQTGMDLKGRSIIMANVVELNDDTYRMYYTVNSPNFTEIRYADSEDAITWEDLGTSLAGATDPSDREFVIGGASVIQLPDGRYRMYYRTSQDEYEGQPDYHIRSAISEDGTVFEREEDVVMEIQPHEPNSEFQLIGHAKFFINDEGLYIGIITANFVDDNGPSDIMVTTSKDGLNWSESKVVFADWHDPAVVYYEGQYLIYATYLKESQGVATSSDGINWSPMESISFKEADETPLSIDEHGLGDLDAIVTKEGKLLLYSNFASPGKPSRDIAVYSVSGS
ncbi:hypothetical protein HN748_02750 [Candidatus Peregrinibacteria bacterium]|jgi:predicted GH43/DUF377 family glycosyl hydrolase|nr:hypothetical protein [Candidatus Peregrinibacteria bacterium]MBT7483845.1 hypothetical protein [Candidatus Peregrinibacteria bacterium]MBT7703127.1 hypothetical protein [Candidatus Peregrinibacteria bacterium]